MSDQPVDDKAHIRHHLDFTKAEWIRAEPEGVTLDDCVEYAFIEHTDGVTYTAMRQSAKPDGVILVFTPGEWVFSDEDGILVLSEQHAGAPAAG